MRIGAKNSIPALVSKRFLAMNDAEKGFISSVCALPRRAWFERMAVSMCENPLKTRLDAH
jgi:hypothetical protein